MSKSKKNKGITIRGTYFIFWITTIISFIFTINTNSGGKMSNPLIIIFLINILAGIGFFIFLLLSKFTFKKPERNKFSLNAPILAAIYFSLYVTLMTLGGNGLVASQFRARMQEPKIENNTINFSVISPTLTEKTKPAVKEAISSPTPFNTNQNNNQQIGNSKDSGNGYPCDDRFATSSEIYSALNEYRMAHGAGALSWNEKLAAVAQMRVAQTLAGGRDYHEGFKEFTANQENFSKVGFSTLSENIGSSGDCPLLGVHLIEYKISKSPAHDAAQRDPSWIAVGIATQNGITVFIFGKTPL